MPISVPVRAAALACAGLLAASCTSQPMAVCPLGKEALAPRAAAAGGVVWNYLGVIPRPAGWVVEQATGRDLVLSSAERDAKIRFTLSCCGELPDRGAERLADSFAPGRSFWMATSDQSAGARRVYWTFPFARVEGAARPRPGELIEVPALLEVEVECGSSTDCNVAEQMIREIRYDEAATEQAVRGEANAGLAGAPLRSDGVPPVRLPPAIEGRQPITPPSVFSADCHADS